MASDGQGFLKQVHAKHGRFLVMPHDVYVGKSLETYGEWCEGEVTLLSKLLGEGATVVEVGANIGSHAVPLARAVGGTGKYFAVELQPFVAQVLSANLLNNGMTHARVVNAGVSDKAGAVKVPMLNYQADYNFGGISVDFVEGLKTATEKQLVQIAPLDDVLDVTRLDLLKMDVEHLELQALQGAAKLIEAHRPFVYLECDDPDDAAGILAFLHHRKYRTFWHRSVLFNPDNHTGVQENIFGSFRCINLLAVPGDTVVTRMLEAPDAASHPKNKGY